MVNGSKLTACIYLKKQPCMTRPTRIDLNPDKYNHGLCYYSLIINLDRCNGSSNTLDDLSDRICVPNKIGNANPSAFNMTTGITESKTLIKHISCKCKCKFDGRKWNLYQKWHNDKCWCSECNNIGKHLICKKTYIWNLYISVCICKNGKYSQSTIDDSIVVTWFRWRFASKEKFKTSKHGNSW